MNRIRDNKLTIFTMTLFIYAALAVHFGAPVLAKGLDAYNEAVIEKAL